MGQQQDLPQISPLMLRFFTGVARRYFRKHFRSVMAQRLHLLGEQRGPLIVYANHSSWWDPLIMILLAQTTLPRQRHYAPMDAAALRRYPILGKVGIFPVEMNSARGAVKFLRTGAAILESGGVLWMTPQGRFADPRSTPLAFKPGLGALATRLPDVRLLPLAIEYTFWDERLPETLLRLGEPRHIVSTSASDATVQLEQALATEMLALQAASMARDATAFTAVISGARGTGGAYGLLRRLRALFSRKPLEQDHTPRAR